MNKGDRVVAAKRIRMNGNAHFLAGTEGIIIETFSDARYLKVLFDNAKRACIVMKDQIRLAP